MQIPNTVKHLLEATEEMKSGVLKLLCVDIMMGNIQKLRLNSHKTNVCNKWFLGMEIKDLPIKWDGTSRACMYFGNIVEVVIRLLRNKERLCQF